MRWIAVLLALAAFPATARADWASDTFAHFTRAAEVDQVHAIRLSGGRDFSHVLFGRHRSGELWLSAAVLLRCTPTRCHGDVVWLHAVDEVRVALVDLRATAAIRPAIAYRPPTSLETRRLRWPALAIEIANKRADTVTDRTNRRITGTTTSSELRIVSLRRRDRERPVVFRRDSGYRSPSGAGFHSSFRVERGEIHETMQRTIDHSLACIAPDPVETRFTWSRRERRFAEARSVPGRRGCS